MNEMPISIREVMHLIHHGIPILEEHQYDVEVIYVGISDFLER